MSFVNQQTNVISRCLATKYFVPVAIIALALSSIGWVSGKTESRTDEISCRKLTLKDARGRDRIVLSVGRKGPKISMLEPDGKSRIELSIEEQPGKKPDEPISVASIKLRDRSKNDNLLIRSFDHGSDASSWVGIDMWNGTETGSAAMSVDSKGESILELKGKTGQISARNIRDDASQISFFDNNAKIRISMTVNSVGDKAWIQIDDKDGKEIWRAPQ